jgi:hypothetical protein
MVNLVRSSAFVAAVLLAGCANQPTVQQYPASVSDEVARAIDQMDQGMAQRYYVQPRYPIPQPPLPPPQAPSDPPSGGSGWIIPGASAAPVKRPAPTPAPVDSSSSDVIPVDNSCGWWRLNNLWGCNR